MTIKRVRARSAKAASHKAPKGKTVTNVNMIDKTRGRKLKTYSLTLKNKKGTKVVHHKHHRHHRRK